MLTRIVKAEALLIRRANMRRDMLRFFYLLALLAWYECLALRVEMLAFVAAW